MVSVESTVLKNHSRIFIFIDSNIVFYKPAQNTLHVDQNRITSPVCVSVPQYQDFLTDFHLVKSMNKKMCPSTNHTPYLLRSQKRMVH